MVGAVLAALAAAHLADALARPAAASPPSRILESAPPEPPPGVVSSAPGATTREAPGVIAAAATHRTASPPPPPPCRPTQRHAAPRATPWRLVPCVLRVRCPGVMAAAPGRRAALDVVDLVPGGFGAEGLLALGRRTPPDRLAGSEANVAPPTGAAGTGHALVLRAARLPHRGDDPRGQASGRTPWPGSPGPPTACGL